MVLDQKYDLQSKAYTNDDFQQFNDLIAKYDDLGVNEAKNDMKLNLGDVSYSFVQPLNDSYHYVANGFVNAWYINPQQIAKNGDGSFTVTLYYIPQNTFYFGLLVSIITLVIFLVYLIITGNLLKGLEI